MAIEISAVSGFQQPQPKSPTRWSSTSTTGSTLSKLEVEILGQSDLSPAGTFEVRREAAEFLCPFGLLESANTRIEWLSEDTFKIWQDKVLTCEDTEQALVLELKNTIVIGQGGIPGKGTWKLKDSTGFDPAPRGKDEIVVVESERGG